MGDADLMSKEKLVSPAFLDELGKVGNDKVDDLPICEYVGAPPIPSFMTSVNGPNGGPAVYREVVQTQGKERVVRFLPLSEGHDHYQLEAGFNNPDNQTYPKILATKGDGKGLRYFIPQGAVNLEIPMKHCRSEQADPKDGSYRVYIYEKNTILDNVCQGKMMVRSNGELSNIPGTEVMRLVNGSGLVEEQYCVKPSRTNPNSYQFFLKPDMSTADYLIHLLQSEARPVQQGLADTLVAGLQEVMSHETKVEDLQSKGYWSSIWITLGNFVLTIIITWRQFVRMDDQMTLMREQMQGPKVEFEKAVIDLTDKLKNAAFEVNAIGEVYAGMFEEVFPRPGLNTHASRNGPTGGSKGWSIEYFFKKLFHGRVEGWKNTAATVWSVSGNSFKASAGAWVNQESKLLSQIMEKAVAQAEKTKGEVFIILREADALLGDGHGMMPKADFFKALLTFMEANDNPQWKKIHWIIDTSRPQAILDVLPDLARRVTFVESVPPKVEDIQKALKSVYQSLQKDYPGVTVSDQAIEAMAYLGEHATRGASPAAQVKLLEELMKSAFVEAQKTKNPAQITLESVLRRVAQDFSTTLDGIRQILAARKADKSLASSAIEKAFYSNYKPVTGTAQTDDPAILEVRQRLERQLAKQRTAVSVATASRALTHELDGERVDTTVVASLSEVVASDWAETPESVKNAYRQASETNGTMRALVESQPGINQATLEAVVPLEFVQGALEGPSPRLVEVALLGVTQPHTIPNGEMPALVDDMIKAWEAIPRGQRSLYLTGSRLKAGVPVEFMRERSQEWERARPDVKFLPEKDWELKKGRA